MGETDPGIDMVRDAVRSALKKADGKPRIKIEHGFQDNLHVLVVSDAFGGLPAEERDGIVWPELRKLPMDVLLRVSLVMLLTLGEYDDLKQNERLLMTTG